MAGLAWLNFPFVEDCAAMPESDATFHAYGWQPSPPDFRDLVYKAAPEVVAALPPKVDLTEPALPTPFEPTWDQGPLGACGAFTSGADIAFAAIRQQGLSNVPKPSTLFIYYAARQVMGTVDRDSGVNNRAMLKALAKYGWCDEANWPYSVTHFKVKPPEHAFAQAATRKIVKYESVPQDLDTMKAALAAGDPFIFGFSVYSSMETQAVQRSGVIPMPNGNDRLKGGHDVLIVGYDDATQRFKLKNSWGGWGNKGYGTIPYAYATNPRLAGDFWTVQHAALADLPTPPPDDSDGVDVGPFTIHTPSRAGGLASIHLKG